MKKILFFMLVVMLSTSCKKDKPCGTITNKTADGSACQPGDVISECGKFYFTVDGSTFSVDMNTYDSKGIGDKYCR